MVKVLTFPLLMLNVVFSVCISDEVQIGEINSISFSTEHQSIAEAIELTSCDQIKVDSQYSAFFYEFSPDESRMLSPDKDVQGYFFDGEHVFKFQSKSTFCTSSDQTYCSLFSQNQTPAKVNPDKEAELKEYFTTAYPLNEYRKESAVQELLTKHSITENSLDITENSLNKFFVNSFDTHPATLLRFTRIKIHDNVITCEEDFMSPGCSIQISTPDDSENVTTYIEEDFCTKIDDNRTVFIHE